MGPFAFSYVALVGFFAFAAIYHLILWRSSRGETLLAVFSADCFVRVLLSAALAAIVTATTPAEAEIAIRARVALVLLTLVTSLWSLRLISGVRARWFAWPATAILLVAFCVHVFVMPLNATVTSVPRLALPWGETIATPLTGIPGWWAGPMLMLAAAIQVFGLYCAARLWARDRVAGGLIMTATGATLLILALEMAGRYHVLSAPPIGVVPHVLWVCVIALLIARGHRQTRRQLAASEERFRGIFDQTFQLIGLLETDGTLIQANRTALEFAGARAEDVLGRPFWETPWWAHSPELQSRLREAIGAATAGEMVRFEATHARPDGRLANVDFSLKPIRDSAGRVTLLIPEARDITDRIVAEEKRRGLEAQLAQRQRMEVIGQLVGGVAHDFNNLLTVINGNSQLLLASAPTAEARDEMLGGIHDAGLRAAALTRQLLTFSGRQIVEPGILDLNVIVAEAVKMLRRLIGREIRLVTDLHPGLAPVKADAGQIGQVILNLAVNARDAMPAGGTLTLRTENIEIDQTSTAMLADAAPGAYVLLAVADTGCGMTAEVKARLFEPFFTTKGPGKGTGLGLATVRAIATESGGFLLADGEPGVGSTFKLFLPAIAAPARPERPAPSDRDAENPPTGSETILLVEDDDAVRAVTREMLRRLGYAVVEASGGAEAIQRGEQLGGAFDLLVTDVVMPAVGGPQVVERLRRTRPDLKVLYLSGFTEDAILRQGVSRADLALLQKPFSLTALALKVRQVLDPPAG